MKPNIFDIATKELHQDAFITWLIKWGDPENKKYDAHLHQCGQDFITKLISAQYPKISFTITKVDADRQWKNIDVWAEIYTSTDNYFIIIEDKTFDTERANQLNLYKSIAEGYCLEKNLKLVCVYIKTGSEPESTLNTIRGKDFVTFTRKNFISLLENYKHIENNIFVDYTARLLNIDASYNGFENKKIKDWTDPCWIGFYQLLEKELGILSWGRVNPPSGQVFWNALLNWEQWKGFPVYLQIEQGKLCFKIATSPDEIEVEYDFNRGEIRNSWSKVILTNASEKGIYEIVRPNKFGDGHYMTVALVNMDSWLGVGDSVVEPLEVIKRLKKYLTFLNFCLN